MHKTCASLFAISLLFATPALADNIVLNPGFEAQANDFNCQVASWYNSGWCLGLLGPVPIGPMASGWPAGAARSTIRTATTSPRFWAQRLARRTT